MESKNKGANSGIGAGASKYSVMSPSEANSNKLPADISRGKKTATDFYQVPCRLLQEFTLKGAEDFSPWPAEKFEELLISVKEVGVLQPVILRPLQGNDGKYEILAGEHRWKASIKLGIEKIPARILTQCDDEQARSIFTLTNILSRELTLTDKIQGWSNYYDLNKKKAMDTIQSLREQGILPSDQAEDISRRQILRYHKINHLQPDLKEAVLNEKLSIHAGEQLTALGAKEQEILSPYVGRIASAVMVKRLLALHQGEIPGKGFDTAGIDFVLSKEFSAPKEASFSFVIDEAKKVLKKRLKKEDYEKSPVIIDEALSLYNQFNGQKKLLEKAVAEYLKNHPEEEEKLGDGWGLGDAGFYE